MKKVCYAIICVVLAVCVGIGATACNKEPEPIEQMDMLQSALDIIQKNYIGEMDIDKLDYVAAKAVIESLDDFTYLSDTLYSQTRNSSIGLGVTISKYNEYYVNTIAEDFPVDHTFEDGFKLQRGDEIYGLSNSNLVDDNGKPIFYRIRGLNSSYFATYSEGGVGTTLTLRIVRNGEVMGDYAYTKIKGFVPRATLIPDVFGKDCGIAYIRLQNFTYTELSDEDNDDGSKKDEDRTRSAGDEFEECIKFYRFYRQKRMVLDLRGNGGGNTNILSKIASYFVPVAHGGATDILEMQYAKSTRKDMVSVTDNNSMNDLEELVILCDGHTASAAEALIGACRAYCTVKVTVIGTDTFGKGVFQRADISLLDKNKSSEITEIPDEYYVVMVSGYYYIIDPHVEGGKYNIQNNPLKPDIYVEANETLGALTDDAEMIAARKVLLGE